jgi:hypothetical protein
MIGSETRQNAGAAGVSGAVAMRIYQAMKEMLDDAEPAIPDRLEPLIQSALYETWNTRCDPRVRGRLETISIRIHHLRAAQRARAAEDVKAHASALAMLAGEWLEETAVY